MSQNPLLQQLVSPLVITAEEMKDPEKAAKKLQVIYATIGTAFQRLQNLVNTDPRMSDTRIAHGIATQQGDCLLDYATLPNPGDVPYAVDGGRRLVFGTGDTPAPTGGGVAPLPGALLPSNPGSPSVLKNSGSGAAWVTIPTRRLWIPAIEFVLLGGTPVSGANGRGTAGDSYYNQVMPAADLYFDASVEVPDNWVSGTITAKVHWTLAVTEAGNNWVPHFYWLERVDGDDMTAAGNHITGPTTSTNVSPDILKITTIGTFTPGAAGRLLRLVFARLGSSDANDTYTDEVNFIGVELSFTPSY